MLNGALLYGVSNSGPLGLLRVRESRVWFCARPAGRRWAGYIIQGSEASNDPRTLADWSRAVGVSRSVLIESCARIGVPARDARDLTRVLRLVRRMDEPWEPELALDVVDRRTLRALLDRAGLNLAAAKGRPTPEQFLLRQRFVPQTSPALVALRQLLSKPGDLIH